MTARLLVGDVRARIGEIPDGSVDLVACSPPFLALRKYGADDREMGSEGTPAAFIDGLLELSGEFRRVLAPHGSIAVELGDTYAGGNGFDIPDPKSPHRNGQSSLVRGRKPSGGRGWPLSKSLAGIPEAYMLSLAYGYNVLDRHGADSPAGAWRVRNVIVWARPNPPVGALGDKVRPATSYITVACVSGSRWFDLDAVREPHKQPERSQPGKKEGTGLGRKYVGADRYEERIYNDAGAPPLDWWEDDDPTGHATLVLPTQPYPGAHYATWPSTLALRLIEMMCPRRVCRTCGVPSRRIVGVAEYVQTRTGGKPATLDMREGTIAAPGVRNWSAGAALGDSSVSRQAPTLGWSDCGHDDFRNGHVLDPFAGSGTSLAVANGCGRDATGIELYPANAELALERCGMFLEVDLIPPAA